MAVRLQPLPALPRYSNRSDQDECNAAATTSKVSFRADIEALRGVAVLAVILYHAWPDTFTGGFLGVDVFFVVSGFVITLMLNAWFATDSYSLQRFYATRFRRLLPASSAALIGTVAGAAWVRVYSLAKEAVADGLAAATFHANYHFLELSTDYEEQGREVSPLLHFWSLAVEEQFYFVYPLLAWACWRVLPCAVSRTAVLAATCAASLAYAQLLLNRGLHMAAFFGLGARWWEMCAGALGVQLWRTMSTATGPGAGRLRTALSVSGAAIVGWGLVVDAMHSRFPGLAALPTVLGTLALLIAGPEAAVNAALARSDSMRWLGARSYSLYLWHWPVLVLLELQGGPWRVVLATLAASTAVAMASERWLERPWRRLPGVRPAMLLGASCIAASLAACLITGQVLPPPQFHGVAAQVTFVDPVLPASVEAEGQPMAPFPYPNAFSHHQQLLAASIATHDIPANLEPPLSNAHQVVLPSLAEPSKPCDGAGENHCTFYPPGILPSESRGTLVLLGDSHARQLTWAAKALAHTFNLTLETRVQGSCSFDTVARLKANPTSKFRGCIDMAEAAIELAKRKDVVLRLIRNCHQCQGQPNTVAAVQTQLHAEIQAAHAPGTSMAVFIAQTPTQYLQSAGLLKLGHQAVTKPIGPDLNLLNISREIQRAPDMAALDILPMVCEVHEAVPEYLPKQRWRCPSIIGNKLVTYDHTHWTQQFSQYIAPAFVDYFRQQLPDVWMHLCRQSGARAAGCASLH